MVIFDIDGTLLVAGGIGRYAFNRVFSEMFDEEDVWGDYDPHGKTDPIIVEELSRMTLGRELNPLEKIEVSRRYVAYFLEQFDSAARFRLMPGVSELLVALSAKPYLLGIATGNFEVTARRKLERGKLAHHFSFGGYGSDSGDRLELTRTALERGLQLAKGQYKHERITLIGDSEADVACAKKLGLKSIAVATGSKTVRELEELNPDMVLKDLSDWKRVVSFVGEL